MAMQISDFNPSTVEFNFFKSADNTKKSVYINKSKGVRESVQLQLCEATPENMVRAPFGISEPMPGAIDNGRVSLEVAIDSEVIGNKFKELDDMCIKYAHKESYKCFGKQLEMSTIRDRFVSPYREISGEGKSNLLRLKISEKTQVMCMHMYDHDTNEIKVRRGNKANIQRGSMIVPQVNLSSIWFVSGDKQFGYSLHVTNVIVNDTINVISRSKNNTGADAFILTDGFKITLDEASSSPSRKRTADDAGLNGKSLDIDDALEAHNMSIDPSEYL